MKRKVSIIIGLILILGSKMCFAGIIRDDFRISKGTAPAIAIDTIGNFIVCWEDNRNYNQDIYAQFYDSVGDSLGADFKVNDDIGDILQEYPSVAINPNGRSVICWEDYRSDLPEYWPPNIWVQLYDSLGGSIGTNFRVKNWGDVYSYPRERASVAMDHNGNFIICGHESSGYFTGQRYTYLGNDIGVPFYAGFSEYPYQIHSIAAYGKTAITPADTINNGGFIISWYRAGSYPFIYGLLYNSQGESSEIFMVNDDIATNGKGTPSVAMDADGNFVICWADKRNGNWDIYAQRYNSSGDTLGINFKVNDDTGTKSQLRPSIAMNIKGDFIICWVDFRNTDSGDNRQDQDIYAQRYSSDGLLLGGNYLINQKQDGQNWQKIQDNPSVVAANNQIIFVWEDTRNAETWDNYEIFAKVVTWDWSGIKELNNSNFGAPKDFSLSQNYPNPFNPVTEIRYALPRDCHVKLEVYNILGQKVAILVDGNQKAGYKAVSWDAGSLSSGIYFYRLKAGDFVETRKMILLR